MNKERERGSNHWRGHCHNRGRFRGRQVSEVEREKSSEGIVESVPVNRVEASEEVGSKDVVEDGVFDGPSQESAVVELVSDCLSVISNGIG